MYMYIYIYIYIYSVPCSDLLPPASRSSRTVSAAQLIYIYIYIYMHTTNIYIYIYIYTSNSSYLAKPGSVSFERAAAS